MIQITHSSPLYPNYLADTALDIDASVLKEAGITHIVFDLDKTLVERRGNTIAPEYIAKIVALQTAGFTILLGSNSRRDIQQILASIHSSGVQPIKFSMKPLPSFYRRIAHTAGTSPDRIAMVGDHILNDVIGANRAGFTTILVKGFRVRGSLLYRTYTNRVLRHIVKSV
jgi:HAD superfamily phosphatase (TIGR01668 family)